MTVVTPAARSWAMMLLACVWNVGMLKLYAMRRPTGAPHPAIPCSMSAPLAV